MPFLAPVEGAAAPARTGRAAHAVSAVAHETRAEFHSAHPVRETVPAHRAAGRLRAVLTALVTLGALIVTGGPLGAGTPAYAAPAPLAAPGDIDEGGSDSLRDQLEAASKGYTEAKAKLDNSVKRQKELTQRLTALQAEVASRSERVAELASMAYRTGRLGQVAALLRSGSPGSLVDRAAALDTVAANEERELRGLRESIEQEQRAKAAIEQEIREQRKQVEVMQARKRQAERALAAAGGGGAAAGVSGNAATAKPAPRNPDGSWPAESCSVDDPTTSGCITPRTLHALNQAKAAGFTRYVSCYRSGGSGEHPKGRACDFAAQKGGFGGVATGGDRTYGNNLAAYFVKNADRLGVLYVIWFKQIWLPSSGWKTYNGGNGDPSSDHTNHVHLSVH